MMQPQTDGPDGRAFEQYRTKLLAVAYRMLGTVGDAEDMVQECFLRWMKTDRAAVQDPEAWLVKVITNLCGHAHRHVSHQ